MIGTRAGMRGRPRVGQATGVAVDNEFSPGGQALVISPQNPTIPILGVQAIVATLLMDDGSTMDVTSQVTWGSSNILLATVSLLGVVVGVALGAPTITATLGALSTQTTVTATL